MKSPNAPLVKELVSNDKLEKKTVFPIVAIINFVKPQQQQKLVRKPVKYVEMYRSQTPKGNQNNWNNKKSLQLGSDFVMPKAVNTAKLNTTVVNTVKANQVNAVKASACWVWRPTKLNSASLTFKRHNYVDVRGRSNTLISSFLIKANLEFCDKHNMVAYLYKPEGSEEFHQIVDFLTASHISYALTKSPTIYVSLIEQFWQTAIASTLKNGDMEITATIDGKVKVVSEAYIRRHLKLEDSDGISDLPTIEIF
ncbi:hypothetical protein Tco_0941983 [Tanacetum coccineum]|uniref:Xylulose kinase-1 n=1 Tax=Tanacetum coccineum TaxID=301880 RepID=A0ABQ5DV64_9ASTR